MTEEAVIPLTDKDLFEFSNLLIFLKSPVTFEASYKNWKGQTATRRIECIEVWHGTTEWHPIPGLFLRGKDLDKGEVRDFYLSDFDMSTFKQI